MAEKDTVTDRRAQSDRREGSADGGRRGGKEPASAIVYVLRSIALIIALFGVIVYTVLNTRPIYSTSGTLGDELRKHAPGVAATIAPGDSTHVDQLMASPKFQAEKRNFYQDLMRLKQVDSARADSIAQYAVREAYIRGISPAIIFGVMLTENAKFVSKATSNVGAVGLMQVYPKIWLTKEMSTLFGKDLVSDSTNVKYGVFILSQYFRPRTKTGQTTDRDWQTALLRYNGCVKGTNTPRCHTYPDKVQRFVEGSAKSICDGRGFYECIAKPFIAGLFGATNGTTQVSTTTAVSPGAVTAPATPPTTTVPVLPPAPARVAPSPTSAPAKAAPSTRASASNTRASASKPTPKKATAKRTARKKISPPKAAKRAVVHKAAKARAEPRLPKPINIIIPSPPDATSGV